MAGQTAQVIQKVLHATIEKKKRKELKIYNLCNTSFSGDVKNGGETVKIIEESEVKLQPGLSLDGGPINYSTLQPSAQELRITQVPYINITLNDIDKQKIQTGLAKEIVDSAIDRGMYLLKDDVDAKLASTYVSAGIFPAVTGTSVVAITPSNALTYLKYMATAFYRARLGAYENDWCAVLPPEYIENLELDSANVYTIKGYDNRVTGWVGKAGRFQIIQSEQIAADSNGQFHPLFLVRGQSIAVAMQKDPEFKDSTRPNYFEESYSYRIAYGYKGYRPDKLGTFPCTIAA